MQLDDNLKQLMKELGAAINDALSDSEDISEAIQNVRNAGYDVFLVLEATIGFNKREEGSEEDEALLETEGEAPATPEPRRINAGKVKWTSQDHKFLRALKISVEDEL